MSDLAVGSLFSGYGGLDLGTLDALGGGRVAWHCDPDPGAGRILDHHFPGLPNHGDIAAVDWSAVEPVDVLTGGFPCQDVSAAGRRRGIRPGTRSGLWTQFAYAIDQLRPELVVIENVRGLLSAGAHSELEPCPWCVGDAGGVALRALGAVLGDLADIGYDASWQGLRASDVGAPHGRFRVFVVAWPASDAGRGGQRAGQPEIHGRESHSERGGDVTARDAAADAAGSGPQGRGHRARRWAEPANRAADPAPHAAGHGRHEGRAGAEGELGRPHAALGGDADAWGPYAAAVHRWEQLTRPAPAPTEPGRNGPRLSPAFSEWAMGLPAGWVTAVPGLSRNAQLKALGNGVVPQQAAAALRTLLPAVPAPEELAA